MSSRAPKLYGRLKQAGAEPRAAEGRGTLAGDGAWRRRLSSQDLATLYTALARQGDVVPLVHRRDAAPTAATAQAPRVQLMSPVAAWYVTDILRNAPAPANAKPGEIAYKTGTSYGFRDAWAVGYDGRHTIAVWVGRPDASATPGLAGRTAAAPVLFDAFARIARTRTPLPGPPNGAIRTGLEELPQR